MAGKRISGIIAATAAALTLGLANAPVAAAETISLSPVLGSTGVGTGSADSSEALVYESVSVTTNANEPGVTRFGGSMSCWCLVSWVNEDTGSTGTNQLPRRGSIGQPQVDPGIAQTGSGRVRATVVVPDGTTFITGSGSWIVP